MQTNFLRDLALTAAALGLATQDSRADLLSRTNGATNPSTSASATVHLDLDDDTGAVAVWSDYQDFFGTVTAVSFETPSITSPFALSHAGGSQGFAFGTTTVNPAVQDEIKNGDAFVRFHSSFPPSGIELSVAIDFGPIFGVQATFASESTVGGVPSGANGLVWLTVDPSGTAMLAATVNNIASPIIAVEVRGPAAVGTDGPLILTVTPPANGTTFSATWTPLTQTELDELVDGLVYVLVRTVDAPAGELRAQLAGTTLGANLTPLGRSFCPGRPNSVATYGAQAALSGSPFSADDDVTLTVADLPPGKLALPLVSTGNGHLFSLPMSNGLLCVSGAPIYRFYSGFGFAAPDGTFTAKLALTELPQPTAPGSELNVQVWYRDVGGAGSTTNFTSAVELRLH